MNEKTLIADPSAIELDAFVSNKDSITVILHSVQKNLLAHYVGFHQEV